MRILENKFFKIIALLMVFILSLPILNYVINALCGFGKIIGTCIRILATI